MSIRLLLLTCAIVAGMCALATMVSVLVVGEVVAFPVFAIAAFAGGLLGARLSRRRAVVEGAVAAVACGLVTALVNTSIDELRLVSAPEAHGAGWVVGVGIVCLAAAIAGGQLGERISDRPPTAFALATAFGTGTLGIGFAALPILYAVDRVGGENAMVALEIPLMFSLPVLSAMLLAISVEVPVKGHVLLLGPMVVMAPIAAAVAHVEPDALGVVVASTLGTSMLFVGLGMAGVAVARPLRRRLGPVERPDVPAARIVHRGRDLAPDDSSDRETKGVTS